MGVFFREFGLTVAFAAFFSLVVARLITPMMAAFFLKNKGHEAEAKPGVFTHVYRDALSWSIRNPWKTVGMGLGVFIARSRSSSLASVPFTSSSRASTTA